VDEAGRGRGQVGLHVAGIALVRRTEIRVGAAVGAAVGLAAHAGGEAEVALVSLQAAAASAVAVVAAGGAAPAVVIGGNAGQALQTVVAIDTGLIDDGGHWTGEAVVVAAAPIG